MPRYDIEALLDDTKSFLISKLNAQISALNTEKNDGIVLKQVDPSAYHLQFLDDRTELADPFILYGEFEEPVIQSTGPQTAITYKVSIWLILADNGLDTKIIQRLFRYRRVFIDLFQANWATFAKENKMKISASLPSPAFQNQETNFQGRAIGVVFAVTSVG